MSSLPLNGVAIPSTSSKAQSNARFEKNGQALPGDIPDPPRFDDVHEERTYLKGRLALAFRIFSKHGLDDGVAGHITVKVLLMDSLPKQT
jgi:hypothetical protein